MNAHMNLFINIANSLPESLQTNFEEQDSLYIPGLKNQESINLIKQTLLHKDLKIQSVSAFLSGLKSREYLMQQLSRALNNILPRTELSDALLEAYDKSFTKTVGSCV
jgi:GGDEF domain-containing protein